LAKEEMGREPLPKEKYSIRDLAKLGKTLTFTVLFFGFSAIQIFASSTSQEIVEWEIKVIAEKANIHIETSQDSPVVMTVPRSSILQSYEKEDEWFRVVYKYEHGIVVIGYIHSSQVKVIKEKVVKKVDFWSEESDIFKGIGLSVKIFCGYDHVAAGEINDGLMGIVDYYKLFPSYTGSYLNGQIGPFHSGFCFGADAIYRLTSRIGIGLGLSSVRWGNLDYIRLEDPIETHRLDSNIRVRAIPVRLGVFYTLPVSKRINLIFNAGPSYYFVKHTYNMQYNPYFVSQKAHGRGWGFHGGLGFELQWNSRSTFFVEYQGRYARLNDFKGLERSYFQWEGQEGSLFYIEYESIPPQIGIFDQLPDWYELARKATYELNGFSIQVGARVKF